MKYYFYYFIFTPAPNIIVEHVIMAENKKQAIRKLVDKEDEDIILRVFKVTENPLCIGKDK